MAKCPVRTPSKEPCLVGTPLGSLCNTDRAVLDQQSGHASRLGTKWVDGQNCASPILKTPQCCQLISTSAPPQQFRSPGSQLFVPCAGLVAWWDDGCSSPVLPAVSDDSRF